MGEKIDGREGLPGIYRAVIINKYLECLEFEVLKV